jgi:hypothetical protein
MTCEEDLLVFLFSSSELLLLLLLDLLRLARPLLYLPPQMLIQNFITNTNTLLLFSLSCSVSFLVLCARGRRLDALIFINVTQRWKELYLFILGQAVGGLGGGAEIIVFHFKKSEREQDVRE